MQSFIPSSSPYSNCTTPFKVCHEAAYDTLSSIHPIHVQTIPCRSLRNVQSVPHTIIMTISVTILAWQKTRAGKYTPNPVTVGPLFFEIPSHLTPSLQANLYLSHYLIRTKGTQHNAVWVKTAFEGANEQIVGEPNQTLLPRSQCWFHRHVQCLEEVERYSKER